MNHDPLEYEVCMCFHVALRKLIRHHKLNRLKVPSQMSECFGAGTGCGWCVPFLESIFEQLEQGEEPTMKVAVEEYRRRRAAYHREKGIEDPAKVRERESRIKDPDDLLDEIPDKWKLE